MRPRQLGPKAALITVELHTLDTLAEALLEQVAELAAERGLTIDGIAGPPSAAAIWRLWRDARSLAEEGPPAPLTTATRRMSERKTPYFVGLALALLAFAWMVESCIGCLHDVHT